jgi:hypothetical protein
MAIGDGVTHAADVSVAVDLAGRLGDEVAAYVESEAGWNVVAGGGPVVPVLTLTATAGPGPCVVVRDGPLDADVTRELLLGGALDVIAWPEDRARLLAVPQRVSRSARPSALAPQLHIGACRGGAGASTVALTAGGLVAWSGRRALVMGDDATVRLAGLGSWQGAGAVELAALGVQAADEVERVARPVPGVQGLSVLGGGPVGLTTEGWPYDIVVVDQGVAGRDRAHLVVGAADGSLAAAPGGAHVLVVEHGPLDRAGVRSRLGRSPAGWLPYSARVARAGTAGRVPSSLPGSWVDAVRKALAAASGPRRPT